MNIVSICLLGIIAAFLSLMLRKYNAQYSMAISLVTGILILGVLFVHITGVIAQVEKLLEATKLPIEYIAILFKALGICFITQFSSDICKDAGETALSSKIEVAGKLIILIISLPLFEKITNIAVGLIK